VYHYFKDEIDDLFQVDLQNERFTISSPIGTTLMELTAPGNLSAPAHALPLYPFCGMEFFGLTLMVRVHASPHTPMDPPSRPLSY
jgi:hypothetical protein